MELDLNLRVRVHELQSALEEKVLLPPLLPAECANTQLACAVGSQDGRLRTEQQGHVLTEELADSNTGAVRAAHLLC